MRTGARIWCAGLLWPGTDSTGIESEAHRKQSLTRCRLSIPDLQHLDLLYCGTASIKLCGAIVATILDILKPAAASNVQNSVRVRSRPELIVNIFRSRILPKCFESFSGTTVSSNNSRPAAEIASRQFLRMVTARSSSQSCTTPQRKYKSPPCGTEPKKSPATYEQRRDFGQAGLRFRSIVEAQSKTVHCLVLQQVGI